MFRYSATIVYRFCSGGLPKPSRFAVELGLDKQLTKVKAQSAKQQKNTTSAYQFAIFGCLCLLGSFALSSFILPELRNRVYMYRYLINVNWDHRKALTDVINYQDKIYKNRIFNDSVGITVIKRCISKLERCLKSEQATMKQDQVEQLRQLLEKALSTNLLNKMNKKTNYSVYRQYLLLLLSTSAAYVPSSNFGKLINFLIEDSDIQILYLLTLLHRQNKLKLSQQQKAAMAPKLQQQKSKIKEDEQKINYLKNVNEEKNKKNKKIGTGFGLGRTGGDFEDYLYWIELRKKWVRFVYAAL